MNIVLIGMRGSGKSAIGRKIAEILSYNFLDLDEVLTTTLNKNIAQIVEEKGWPYFRQEEAKVCELISQKNNAVIATGGGIVLNKENIKNLKKNGVIILLNCDLETLKNRRKNQAADRENRPLLKGPNITTEIEKVWEERKPLYTSAADIIFDANEESSKKTDDLEKKALKIIEVMKS
ncbi:shikimate kinase [Candidatus Peregrinibacteria bacterium]|jgi:shikimate kinase|nr:shikimate kinase [Candidatus Peregrinibacteria bacterium]